MKACNLHWSNWMTWFFALALAPLGLIARMVILDLWQQWESPEGMGWKLLSYAPLCFPLLSFGAFYWALSIRYELADDQIIEKRFFFKNRVFDLHKITRWESSTLRGISATTFFFADEKKLSIEAVSRPTRLLIERLIEEKNRPTSVQRQPKRWKHNKGPRQKKSGRLRREKLAAAKNHTRARHSD